MIHVVKRNIFDMKVDAYVNPVNCVGVSGAGLAKQFRKRFPELFYAYRRACLAGEMTVGSVLGISTDGNFPKVVYYFPTKTHWRNPSERSFITMGLDSLSNRLTMDSEINSIAIPALGCGLGGLDWEWVREEICTFMSLECHRELTTFIIPPRGIRF